LRCDLERQKTWSVLGQPIRVSICITSTGAEFYYGKDAVDRIPYANIVPLQRKDTGAMVAVTHRSLGCRKSDVSARAHGACLDVAKQMRYFKLVAVSLSFNEVLQSTKALASIP